MSLPTRAVEKGTHIGVGGQVVKDSVGPEKAKPWQAVCLTADVSQGVRLGGCLFRRRRCDGNFLRNASRAVRDGLRGFLLGRRTQQSLQSREARVPPQRSKYRTYLLFSDAMLSELKEKISGEAKARSLQSLSAMARRPDPAEFDTPLAEEAPRQAEARPRPGRT
jgi:hypothetical protein